MARPYVRTVYAEAPLVARIVSSCPHCSAPEPNIAHDHDGEQRCILCGWRGWSRRCRDMSAFEVLQSQLDPSQWHRTRFAHLSPHTRVVFRRR